MVERELSCVTIDLEGAVTFDSRMCTGQRMSVIGCGYQLNGQGDSQTQVATVYLAKGLGHPRNC